ncbi:DNA repair protein RadA [Aminithiophilus ramosus]|uniref:DNA repair protein RadA n=2 Tax=Synergistales TaxID=649776 RepID=A0A9Q7EU34_9BACT|nr:DNA repair protein RadA [Aminithiophilus ramosus]QTX31433.1 DNA repair protein RadA [Aminithiophilus ramosus]QVL35236.1 DNA repair protein RadA [Synergistota bacterium]
MAKKTESRFLCGECGHRTVTWTGRCPGCGAWGTLAEILEEKGPGESRRARVKPLNVFDVEAPRRVASGIDELDRVLGGGWVPGGVSLLGGEPGIGKSTLLLQACAAMASQGRKVLYLSGEESASQVALRARRLGATGGDLHLVCQDDLESALASASDYAFVVADSVQALKAPGEPGWPGTPSQVRAVAQTCISLAKAQAIPFVLVGHITKEGQLAGPKLLEHMVDVVLLFSGERSSPYRLLRALKNRYGATDELGIFEMIERGLAPVEDASLLYWNAAEGSVPGVAMTVALEGSRPLVAEVQALACATPFPYPKRTARGVDVARVQLLLAVLERRCGLSYRTSDVYVNIAGGLQVRETSADLALCMALASAATDRSLPPECCFLGEVGLAGEIRPCRRTGLRLREAARLGFRRAVVSRRDRDEMPSGMDVVAVSELKEALEVMER